MGGLAYAMHGPGSCQAVHCVVPPGNGNEKQHSPGDPLGQHLDELMIMAVLQSAVP